MSQDDYNSICAGYKCDKRFTDRTRDMKWIDITYCPECIAKGKKRNLTLAGAMSAETQEKKKEQDREKRRKLAEKKREADARVVQIESRRKRRAEERGEAG